MLNLGDCLQLWRAAIGPSHVLTNAETLGLWGRATFPWSASPQAVLRPGTAEEVTACLQIASECRCPVHPVSRGRSWGYGSRLPVHDAVMLDLSRLDRILDLDLQRGTVRVEPGVTFRQLQGVLKEHGLSFHLPAFGGPLDASVLANALERGEGSYGPLSDRFGQLWDLDVALTTGERLRTGHGRYGEQVSAQVHARPAGPLLEGLFSQSGFGIVLSGRLALAPTPALAFSVTLDIGPPEKLDAFIDRVRNLLRGGVVDPSSVYLCDGAKRLSTMFVRSAVADEVLADPWLTTWSSIITVTGDHAPLVEAKLVTIKSELEPLAISISVGSDRDEQEGRVESYLTGLSDGRNLTSCYWAKRSVPAEDADPDRDRCGFLWICPVVPLSGVALRKLIELTGEASRQHGVFAAISVRAVSLRAVHGYVSFAWDRDEPGADERALACHGALLDGLWAAGFLPFRLALPTIEACPDPQEEWSAAVSRIRHALDPSGVLAPGRAVGLPVDHVGER
jgi:4-cresol dehydrogenase (hydroxylating)